MLLLLFDFLSARLGLKIPTAFSYCSSRMLLAALTTLVLTIFLGPRFIRKLYELKMGQPIRVEDCPLLGKLHEKKRDTPTMGGILILFSMVVALFLWMDLTSQITWLLLITTVCGGFIGGMDDYLKLRYKNSKGLAGRKKLLFQVLLAAGLSLYLFWPGMNTPIHDLMPMYFFPFFKDPVLVLKGMGIAFGILFTIFVIVASSNGVNLTDGLDGLAAGTVVLVALVLSVVAFLSNNAEIATYLNLPYIESSGEVAVYLCALMGACLGFLWYNGYPAQVFMGDTGSLALGAILGVSAILLRREILFAIAGGIFVAETVSVILQVGSYKLRNRKRIFLCTPLHHHFEYKGWSETKVVLRFWIVGLVLALFSLILLKLQ